VLQLITHRASLTTRDKGGYGRGAGVGRGLGVGEHLPVQGVGVAVGVGLCVGLGVGPDCAQYMPPRFPDSGY